VISRDEAADFLFHEAELLDEHRFEDWLHLFTDDARYWVPQGHEDPGRQLSLVYDDRSRMLERVARLSGGFAYAQQPLARTVHLIGNVRVSQVGEHTLVRSNCVVTAHRRGHGDLFSGAQEHHLRRSDDGLRIAAKTVRLAAREQSLGNLTFLL
jgi:3-phenylpropionate/cinnamic acid dioxygenase small subunit